MQEAGSVTVKIRAELAQFHRGLNEARAETQRFDRAAQAHMRGTERAMQQLGTSARQASAAIRIMTGAFAAIGGAAAIRQLQQYADIWIRVQNQLKVAGLEGDALGATLDELYAIAQRNGVAIEPLATLYGRLAQAQKELGATGAELTRFTEGVSLALRVAGTDAAGASGALLQLSQALGGAIVRAEEFNSINEGARPILQAVANGLEEAGGSIAKLRSLVVEGRVSSEAFFRAFLAGMGDLEAQAATTEQTSSQAFARVENALARLVGEIDNGVGVSRNFANFLGRIADALTAAANQSDVWIGRLNRIVGLLEQIHSWTPGGALMSLMFGDPGRFFEGADSGGPSWERGGRGPRPAPEPVSIRDFAAPTVEESSRTIRERADAYERATAAIRSQIEALRLEAEILGLSTDAQEAARIEVELMNAAREAGRTLTPQEIDDIRSLAAGYGEAAAELERMHTAAAEAAEAQRFFADTVYQAFADLIPQIDTGIAALDRLIERLIEAVLQAALLGSGPLAGLFGGGLLSGLGFARGGVFAGGNVIPFARGGIVSRPTIFPMARGAGLMGEAGPEAIMPLRRDSAGRLGVIAANENRESARPINVVVNTPPGTDVDDVRQRHDGGVEIDLVRVVDEAQAERFGARGAAARAAERRYGLNPVAGVPRRRR